MAKNVHMTDGVASGGKHSGDMHEGMKRRNPSGDGGHDVHGACPGGHSIDNEATRDSTAATPSTLGPRRI